MPLLLFVIVIALFLMFAPINWAVGTIGGVIWYTVKWLAVFVAVVLIASR